MAAVEIMANVLMIIAPKNFRDEELLVPKQILEKAGHKVAVESITTAPCKGMKGVVVTPQVSCEDADAADYDMIVVVGGSGAPELVLHGEVLSLIETGRELNKQCAAICLGPMVLAKAGILEGKRATVYDTPESREAFEEGRVIYTKEDVVMDDHTVTANGPQAAKRFGEKLVEVLKKVK